jgi:hypothetical protein
MLATGLSSTETGFVTTYLADHTSQIPAEDAPLGYPLSGMQVVLLNDNGAEARTGETGEIAIRSRYLTPGYWRRPDLSASKFLSDPADNENRLYLTGDLGCLLPDGCLVYKGRKDFRVKVRGYRVELTELEKTLLEHPYVSEAVVKLRRNLAGESELVAFFTQKQGRLTADALRSFLEQKLPAYMVPSLFVHLDAMPITSNGKIDRRALPPITTARPDLAQAFVWPRNRVEEELAGIWSEVLSISPVGVHDRFLDLGGTSLSATRVLSRVFKKYQLEISIQALFQSPTIAEMANVITQAQSNVNDEWALAGILRDLESLSDEQAQESVDEKNISEYLRK